jgi:hypothetical protein
MLPRHAISDADWDRIEDLLPGRPGQPGWLAKDNRLFLDAVPWIAPGQALPQPADGVAELPRFGKMSALSSIRVRGRQDSHRHPIRPNRQ